MYSSGRQIGAVVGNVVFALQYVMVLPWPFLTWVYCFVAYCTGLFGPYVLAYVFSGFCKSFSC